MKKRQGKQTNTKPTVSKILEDSAVLFEKKNKEYGDAYRKHARIMSLMMGPIELNTAEDFERYTRISSIIAKANRYAQNFKSGGHKDSADDLVVFSAMLAELHQ